MMRWPIAIFLLLWPVVAAAQDIRVLSGDHPGFTRLVVLSGASPEWTLGRTAGGYELRIARPDATFDISSVFSRIGRNRIASVAGFKPGGLFLEVGCGCHADAFQIPQGIVIDIADGPPDPDSVFEAALAPIQSDVTATPLNDTPRNLPQAPDTTVPLETPFAWQNGFGMDLGPSRPDATGGDHRDAPRPVDPALQERLTEFQAELLAQISRAAGQGMIEADIAPIPPPGTEPLDTSAHSEHDPTASASDTIAVEPEKPVPASPADALLGHENIKIETAVDRGQSGPLPAPPLTLDGEDCIDDQMLDIASWGDPIDDGASVARFRGDILGALDDPDPGAVAMLARNYIYLSFGAEAHSLLDAFGDGIWERDLYFALASIMDHDMSGTYRTFDTQIACDTRAALWAVLSRARLRPADRTNVGAVISAFSELPIHLRRHLGPGLVERFLDIGDGETANRIRNAVARAAGPHGDDLLMIEADIAIEAGNLGEAAANLESIVDVDGPLAPEALIRLIDAATAAGEDIPRKYRENAAALAYSNRGTALGADLDRVHIRALAHAGLIEDALTELARVEKDLSPDRSQALKLDIFDAATGADDLMFLKAVLPGPIDLGPGDKAGAIRRQIAERLVQIGLTEAARVQMSEDRTVPTDADRLIYATAYLKEQRPDLVMSYLAGLDGPEANGLRARALEMAGDYAGAADAYAALGDDSARANAVWRGQDWANSAVSGPEEIQREAAGLASANAANRISLPAPEASPDPSVPVLSENTGIGAALAPPIPPGSAPPENSLSATRDLLDQSRQSRRILEDLLSAPLAPES